MADSYNEIALASAWRKRLHEARVRLFRRMPAMIRAYLMTAAVSAALALIYIFRTGGF